MTGLPTMPLADAPENKDLGDALTGPGYPAEPEPVPVSAASAAGIPIAGHTPGPWHLRPHSYGYDLIAQGGAPEGYGGWLIELHSGERDKDGQDFRDLFEANAAFIVRACNSHYELLEALEAITTPTGFANLEASGNGTHGAALAALAKARGQ